MVLLDYLINHEFVSEIADDPADAAAGDILPQAHWNAPLVVQGPALSLLGVAGNADGAAGAIVADTDGYVLRRSGSSIGFGLITAAVITGLATVATSGAYADLSGRPTLGSLASLNAAPAGTLTGTTLAANVVTSSLTAVGTLSAGSIPTSLITGLAAVATSGSASDLGTGTLPTGRLSGSYTGITGVGTLAAGSIPYSLLTGTPTIPAGANPSASVGVSAVNGSASTFMRSDAAPTLDQTAAWAFSGLGATTIANAASGSPAFTITGAHTAGTIVAGFTPGTVYAPFDLRATSVAGTFPGNNKGLLNLVDLSHAASNVAAQAAISGFGSDIGTNTTGRIWFFGPDGGSAQLDLWYDQTGPISLKTGSNSSNQALLFVPAAATLQLGAAAADTTGVSQTLQAQGVTTGGTNNQAGGNLTIASGQGKGTPISRIIFNVPISGASGNTLQTMKTLFSIGDPNTGAGRTAIFSQETTTGLIIQDSVASDTGFLLRVSGGIPLIAATYGSTGSYQPLDFYTNGTMQLRINTSGGLGLATTSDPGAGLIYTNSASFMLRTKTSLTGGGTTNVPTLTAGPVNGNPTKWLPYDDNGTTRYIPAW